MNTSTGFISIFMLTVSNCMLYSKDHASVAGLIERAFSILNDILEKSGAFELMIIEDDLVINKEPLREIGLQEKNLMKRLKRKGITHINFSKGVTISELRQLVAHISTTEKGIKASPHIKVGVVDVHIGGFKGLQSVGFRIDKVSDTQKRLSEFTSEQIEKAKEEYSKISPFKMLHLAGFEELIVQFVLMLKKEVNILKLLRPVQSYSGYDETHATNVSVLTIFQAQSIGIREEFHGDIGLAALLHDVGKLFIPREILMKESSLEEKEKKIMELHPLYGAQYLAKIEGLTRLAPIVAFEHHLRYDGSGYPKLKGINIKQHICSQMTAISDTFDTLRNTGSYKKALDLKDVLITMKTKDSGLFNPFLIDNFIRSIHLALSKSS
jgi:HD-GYP domain-containing protein (c-di-GMP phosphodiesterase class II)